MGRLVKAQRPRLVTSASELLCQAGCMQCACAVDCTVTALLCYRPTNAVLHLHCACQRLVAANKCWFWAQLTHS